jgi:large subunit ribosomal protein L22
MGRNTKNFALRKTANEALEARQFRAVHRYARSGEYKARRIIDMIRGLPVNRALDLLSVDRHRATPMVRRVLESAVANALQDAAVRANRLVVSQAWVGGGPLLMGRHRWRPGPQGRAFPIRKRTCHIHVYVADPQVAPPAEASAPPAESQAADAAAEPTEKKAKSKAPKQSAKSKESS